MLLAACGADATPPPTPAVTANSTPVATTTIAPSLTNAPALTPSPTPASWLAAPVQPQLDDVQLVDLAWTGARFVGVGSDVHGRIVFLDSTDGLTWHRQQALGSTGQYMSLAAGPSGVVAVGGTVEGSNGAFHRTSWFSPDGLTWVVQSDAFRTASGAKSQGSVSDVVAAGDGWLAVGSHEPACEDVCGPDRALVWTSSNGTDWIEIPDAKALHTGFMQVVAHGSAGFVAVGQSVDSGDGIWTSPDGLAWSSPQGDAIFAYANLTAVAMHDGVAVVLGATESEADGALMGHAWWSSGGSPWSAGTIDGVTDYPTVNATQTGFIGTGGVDGVCAGGIWSSTDGRAWACDGPAAGFSGIHPVAVAASSTVEVAMGVWFGGNTPGFNATAPPGVGRFWYRSLP